MAYLAFCTCQHHNEGGLSDCIGFFTTQEEAWDSIASYTDGKIWEATYVVSLDEQRVFEDADDTAGIDIDDWIKADLEGLTKS